jgi:hypothetical protein
MVQSDLRSTHPNELKPSVRRAVRMDLRANKQFGEWGSHAHRAQF